MTPEQLTQFNQMLEKVDKLYDLYFRTNFVDKVVHEKPLYLRDNLFIKDGLNLATGTSTGLKIGTSTSNKIGFYGVTPVDQPATVTDPSGGVTIDSEARTAIIAVIDRLQELGLVA